MDEWRTLNRAQWDERVAVHTGPGGYDMAELRAGRARLNAIEEAELGPVAGLRVLHLQCHFGRDSLILAQRGAEVLGVDFSPPAIATATALADELRLPARFVLSDVYDAPAAVGEAASFDLAYVTWGTVGWLPDVFGWARVVAHFLKPGGAFYFADAHPVAMVFQTKGVPTFEMPYFGRAPMAFDNDQDYVDQGATLANTRTVQWLHPLTDVLSALTAAGLRLEWLHEHDAATWRIFDCLVEDAAGLFRWPDEAWLPLSYSLRAVRT